MTISAVESILEGRFALDGGAMFGVVPRPLWTRTNPSDEVGRIELGARCLLIRHPTAGNILCDVGIGHKWDDKGRRIYKIRHGEDEGPKLGLEASLGAAGLSMDDIDHVILTHLHFDHAGGLTRWTDDGGVALAFPGRPHYVLREQWSHANAPTERDAGSYRAQDFRIFEDDPDKAPLHLIEGWSELFEGVTLIPRRGHTFGMACVKVETDDGVALFAADLIPTAGHIRVPYVMGYDLQPAVTCREKREILSEASRHGWRVFFGHDPHRAWCRVEEDGRGGFRQVPDNTNKETPNHG